MRNTLNDIYFGKTKDIIASLRFVVNFLLFQYFTSLRNQVACYRCIMVLTHALE